MLVIRRRTGESLLIGEEIEIEVLEASGSQVKLGIRAPKAIPVVRKEILVVGAQNREASRKIPANDLEKVLSVLRNSSNKPATLR
jgi:carbon storage regulator